LAITKVSLRYTGSPQVKISQKVLRGYFFDSHCTSTHLLRLYTQVTK